jgi:hypothetical protein
MTEVQKMRRRKNAREWYYRKMAVGKVRAVPRRVYDDPPPYVAKRGKWDREFNG